MDRIRNKYPQIFQEKKVSRLSLTRKQWQKMKKDKAMEFNSNKEISDNVGIDSEVQKSGRQKTKTRLVSGLRNILNRYVFVFFVSVGWGR